MRITRLTKIREHRLFRDFAWPGDLHSFGQFNLIYGWNGCGKTTLASLLALAEKRVPLSEGEIELEFDDATKVAGTNFGSAQFPQLRVFNRDFISSTLQATSDIAPIYFLGEDSAEKQSRLKKLRDELGQATAAVTIAATAKSDCDAKLDNFCIDRAKLIKEHLTTGHSAVYNNYDKRRFAEAAKALNPQSAAATVLSDAQKTSLRKQKDAQPKAKVENMDTPTIDLSALVEEVDTLVGRSVVARTLDELTGNAVLASWVERGLALHSDEHASDICRFCSQPFEAERRAVLQAHFNDAFAALQRDIAGLLSELQKAKQILTAIPQVVPSRFYDHLFDEVRTAGDTVAEAQSATEMALDALIAVVEAKRESPFGALPRAPAIEHQGVSLADAIAASNAVIDKHNKTTEDFKRSVNEACNKLEAGYVAEEHAEYCLLVQVRAGATTVLGSAEAKTATIREEIAALEREILEHRRPADELTNELRAYLGREELRFDVEGNGYALTRGGRPVAHLSEGERTAITFLYFLKSLQDKTFDMRKGIVVIDDPVSSLDANALFSAFAYMKERTRLCGQLFILTHNFAFFRLVKNWFHYTNKHWKKLKLDRQPARFFLLRSCWLVGGLHATQLGLLDPLLEEHESEYQYLFKRVYEEAHRSDVASLEQHYGLPNVARRLLETFLAFRYPDIHGNDRLHRCFDRASFDESKKTRILRFLNTYSHAGAIADPEHDLSLLAEAQPVLRDVLEMMKVVDRDHYEGLEKLVTPADGDSPNTAEGSGVEAAV